MFFDREKNKLVAHNSEDMDEVTLGTSDIMGKKHRRYQSNKFGSVTHGLDKTQRLPATNR